MVWEIAGGIVLGVIALALIFGAARESRGEPGVFWGLVAIYAALGFGLWWGARYLGII